MVAEYCYYALCLGHALNILHVWLFINIHLSFGEFSLVTSGNKVSIVKGEKIKKVGEGTGRLSHTPTSSSSWTGVYVTMGGQLTRVLKCPTLTLPRPPKHHETDRTTRMGIWWWWTGNDLAGCIENNWMEWWCARARVWIFLVWE